VLPELFAAGPGFLESDACRAGSDAPKENRKIQPAGGNNPEVLRIYILGGKTAPDVH
jgi:hypothetical protein